MTMITKCIVNWELHQMLMEQKYGKRKIDTKYKIHKPNKDYRIMNSLDKQYKDLLEDILENGTQKSDRTGTGTISVFGRQIRHRMSDGFPLLTTKKMYWKGIVTEMMWFLRGDTNIKFLVDNDVHIWDGDDYKNFIDKTKGLNLSLEINKDIVVVEGPIYNATLRLLSQEEFINKIKTDDEFAKKWGELGPVYGKQWRAFGGYAKVPNGWNHGAVASFKDVPKCDQIQNLIDDLRNNPDSRRIMVTAWNPVELDEMVLPPCHYGFQVYTRELTYEERIKLFEEKTNRSMTYTLSVRETLDSSKIPTRAISLMWNQRSVDAFLGLPFNIASYGLLLQIIAESVNMVPDELVGNLGDVHLYSNHIEQAQEQISRKPYKLPKLSINSEFWAYEGGECGIGELAKDFTTLVNSMLIEDFQVDEYVSHPTIKATLSN